MLYGFLVTLFVIACLFLIVLVLMQKGKGGMGIGSMGGGSQMLFGGSGGQDFFQKATWVLGAVLVFGSLGLGLMKSRSFHDVKYASLVTPANPLLPLIEAEKTEKASTAAPVQEVALAPEKEKVTPATIASAAQKQDKAAPIVSVKPEGKAVASKKA